MGTHQKRNGSSNRVSGWLVWFLSEKLAAAGLIALAACALVYLLTAFLMAQADGPLLPKSVDQLVLESSSEWSLRTEQASSPENGNQVSDDVNSWKMPSLEPKTLLIAAHLVGLVLGFGSALFLDLYLLRYLLVSKIEPHTQSIAGFGMGMVSGGLALLWITGIGFLLLYWQTDPAKLSNPKIWAKVSIVVILSLNGAVIHAMTMKLLGSKAGHRLLEGETTRKRHAILFTGAVSAVSWASAMLLGVFKEFNDVVPAGMIIALYATAILGAHGLLTVLCAVVRPKCDEATEQVRVSEDIAKSLAQLDRREVRVSDLPRKRSNVAMSVELPPTPPQRVGADRARAGDRHLRAVA